ncbi:MAG: hypothetical protein V4722_24950, partial [Bacteroidota bacterium]
MRLRKNDGRIPGAEIRVRPMNVNLPQIRFYGIVGADLCVRPMNVNPPEIHFDGTPAVDFETIRNSFIIRNIPT